LTAVSLRHDFINGLGILCRYEQIEQAANPCAKLSTQASLTFKRTLRWDKDFFDGVDNYAQISIREAFLLAGNFADRTNA